MPAFPNSCQSPVKKTMENSGVKFLSLIHMVTFFASKLTGSQFKLPGLFMISLAFINSEASKRKMEFLGNWKLPFPLPTFLLHSRPLPLN